MAVSRARDLLETTPLGKDVDAHHLDRLAARTIVKTAAPGDTLFGRDDATRTVVVLLQGVVEIATSGEDGKASTIGFMGPGMVGGDAALLDEGSYAVTVTAARESVYLAIDGATFLQVMRDSAALSFNTARTLARRLRMMFRRNEWLMTLGVPLRLARFLLWLDDQQAARGTLLAITQEELGQLIGVSRETVNKTMRPWATAGWLRQTGGGVEVLARDALLAVVTGAPSELLHSGAAPGG